MRIGINYRFIFEEGTGRYVYVKNLIRALTNADTNVSFVLFTPKELPQKEVVPNAENIVVPWENVHDTSFDKAFTKHEAVHKANIDVLFQTYNAVPKVLPAPTVMVIHDLISTNFYSLGKLLSGKAPYKLISTGGIAALFHEPKEVQRVTRVVAISEHVKRDIVRVLRYPEARVDVIYPGIEEAYFTPPPSEKLLAVRHEYRLPERFILYLGGFIFRKNVKRIIEAYTLLSNSITSQYSLVLVGNGYWERYVKKACAKNHRIIHLNKVPFEALSSLYHLSSLFVYPSLSEGFGIPVLEAAATGTPVVTSAGSPMQEISKDTLFYCDPYDTSSLSQAMQNALRRTTPEQRERAKEVARAYHWEGAAKQMLETFRGVARGE